MTVDLDRRPFPTERRIVLGGLRSGKRMATMTALVQVDVSNAMERVRSQELSATAFVLACVGRAVASHPEVHAYRGWSGRLVMHRHVDIATMVEVHTSDGVFPLAHPVRDTESRSVSDISSELRAIRHDPTTSAGGRMLMRWGSKAGLVPGLIGLGYLTARHSPSVRRRTGTVTVSSVGMMMGGNGFAIGTPTISTLTVIVGGMGERPWVIDGELTVRTILDLTVQVDHRIVDGAPAARFGATLRRLLEHPDLITW
ncbi:MAG: 2-oxo acid dehydrogenase subunit E2 [Acidimicrobiia bacterium]|nr:2-oxo acid dehydrogenase subunit E2 [Acidimicrobiia bacterium]